MAECTFLSSAHGTLQNIPHIRPQNKSTNSRRLRSNKACFPIATEGNQKSIAQGKLETPQICGNYTLLTNGLNNSQRKLENTFETSKH